MAPRKRKEPKTEEAKKELQGYIAGAGLVQEQRITNTLEQNYMPYAMSVIMSRALPEIDGFKPSHRKLLYTMYKQNLLTGARTKSANVVGATMRLNPHGDAAIYDTMVRLSRGYEALLHPFVDSKGNFGKAYSRDMACAASRYTEVKLDPICAELFRDIDKDTVDFVPNYDNTTTEPLLLPTTFPSILVNANVGIAVSMASSICSFNLAEVCDTTIALIRHPGHEISETLKAPDFSGGGFILYNRDELERIYETGRGSVRVRCRYRYDKPNNCIEVTEIPPTTTVEAIMDKVIELVKLGKVREISDIRDETDRGGLKLTMDLKRGVDPDKLMQKLCKMTPLEDSYSCNFNVLIGGMPRVLGVREILEEWTAFRVECVRRRVYYELSKKKEKLHLLDGLAKILLDIDRAIKIVRETEEEAEVVPNLMIGFGIDRIQAEYVAEIRLRHLNREFILRRTEESADLRKDIAEMEDVLKNPKKVLAIIISELEAVAKKYGKPRKSELLFEENAQTEEVAEEVPDYPVRLFLTAEGYFKKITPQSLRMSSDQKVKEGDKVILQEEAQNTAELLFFSNQGQVYKTFAYEFDDTKASVLGDYVPAKLGFDEGEKVAGLVIAGDFSGYVLFFFENGKVSKVPLSSYQTKTKRKKLTNAYSTVSPLVALFRAGDKAEYMLISSNTRRLLFNSAMIQPKATRDSQGVSVMTQKKGCHLETVLPYKEGDLLNPHRFRTRTLPAAGALPKEGDLGEQMSLL